ncbi:hypothetical protein BLOT_001742 [Blomia tropicalis]|nr:hypothetical protein BLOT_001742 [Blomia tropicalis]
MFAIQLEIGPFVDIIMEQTLEYIIYATVAMLILSLIAIMLIYLNRLLERRSQAKRSNKLAQIHTIEIAIIESSAMPVLLPLPTYDQIAQTIDETLPNYNDCVSH